MLKCGMDVNRIQNSRPIGMQRHSMALFVSHRYRSWVSLTVLPQISIILLEYNDGNDILLMQPRQGTKFTASKLL